MSAQKCQKCGVRVFFYRDESTGAEKCPSCGTTNPHTPEEDSPIKCPSFGSELFWSMGGFMLKLSWNIDRGGGKLGTPYHPY